MRIVSFNINSIRAHFHQLEALVKKYAPDLIALQETKVQNADFPHQAVQKLGYEVLLNGQKKYHGVAILSRLPLLKYQKDMPGTEAKRLLYGQYDLGAKKIHLLNAYFPQGEHRHHPSKFPAKRQFYQNLRGWLADHFDPQDWIILAGDMNIAPYDSDIGIGQSNAKRWLKQGKCSFLPEERAWFQSLLDWGLYDAYHQLNQTGLYSWFDYRSKGFNKQPKKGLRIDIFLLSQPVMNRLKKSSIDYAIRGMSRPSDHCPIWLELDI